MDVITASGSSLNPRHIHVLVDTMTFSGNIMSIDRFGINRTNYNHRKSFLQEMTDQLYKSAMFGEIDNCKGVSANVLLGQESNAGTGYVIYYSIAAFYSQNDISLIISILIYDNLDINDTSFFNNYNNSNNNIHDLPAINLILQDD